MQFDGYPVNARPLVPLPTVLKVVRRIGPFQVGRNKLTGSSWTRTQNLRVVLYNDHQELNMIFVTLL